MKAAFESFYKINVYCEEANRVDWSNIRILQENEFIDISIINKKKDYCELVLAEPVYIKKKTYLFAENSKFEISYSNLFKSQEFNEKYFYDGFLGARIIDGKTEFKVWSPVATSINVLLYKNGDPLIEETPIIIPLQSKRGVFSALVEENYIGYYYTYQVEAYGKIEEVVDPYAKAVGVNGLRGCIIDLESTNPIGWDLDKPIELKNYTDAVIYEISIRDISSNDNSGVQNKGKFIGLLEESKTAKGVKTGLEHIKELGVTHVQILPMYDFHYQSVDERDQFRKYNWGYDPQNYNAVEGSYSTNPYDAALRIKELKEMIKKFHQNNIGVIMDVVYNHVYEYKRSNFEKLVPGYYFRHDRFGNVSNGSGCGNDVASENKMTRRFIIDSVTYWAKEYHLDGFRFDLLGLLDIDTVNSIYEELKKINPNIIVYGEGWDLNTYLENDKKATQYNAYKTPKIGYFNDVIRDAVRGHTFEADKKGFAGGGEGKELEIKRSVVGLINYNESLKGPFIFPSQSINYVSCHDNHTLWDKINITNKEDSVEERIRVHKLSHAIVLTSQGASFLHLGCDFCRTKHGHENSYNLPDSINSIDWDRKYEFRDVFEYIKGLVKLRKEHPAFRMSSASEVVKHIIFLDSPEKCVAFMIHDHANNDIWKDILVIYNSNKSTVEIKIPNGVYNVVADGRLSGVETLYRIYGDKVKVAPISCIVAYR
ncbi:Pullulanase precursor [Caloramator mitchellensis]|uniref:Pullulanase n=1 Tax=Caloramator mitchellensis TaxID=908809 RepID=A0A0R3JUF7_CALMK|nr:type I pullulanase [Caloramator mitchellensis]KRQ87193.1 Pullulanase precursor [Caloramator mitchellensis]